jgi:nitrile hydratase
MSEHAKPGDAAIAELGYTGVQGEGMVVVENTAVVHNLVFCTLCPCYPWPTLGLPPNWYKSAPYRSRAVMDPRGVLNEFGLTVPETTEVCVWDSSAELRYLVLPMRSQGTEGMTEAELAKNAFQNRPARARRQIKEQASEVKA